MLIVQERDRVIYKNHFGYTFSTELILTAIALPFLPNHVLKSNRMDSNSNQAKNRGKLKGSW